VTESEKATLEQRRKILRRFREQVDLSLDALASRAGLSKSMLSKFELGHRDLSREAWGRVIVAMGEILSKGEEQRSKERAKRDEAEAKRQKALDGLFSALGMHPLPFTFRADEETKQKLAELDAEKIRLSETSELFGELGREAAILEKPSPEEIKKCSRAKLEKWVKFLADQAAEANAYVADRTAKGYKLLHVSVEWERDRLLKEEKAWRELLDAEYEEKKALRSQIERLQQELARGRVKKSEDSNEN
jgi:transcriptional regulator with XRE-family HTH domain